VRGLEYGLFLFFFAGFFGWVGGWHGAGGGELFCSLKGKKIDDSCTFPFSFANPLMFYPPPQSEIFVTH